MQCLEKHMLVDYTGDICLNNACAVAKRDECAAETHTAAVFIFSDMWEGMLLFPPLLEELVHYHMQVGNQLKTN